MGSKRKRSAQEALSTAPAAKKQQKLSKQPAKPATTPPPLDSSPFADNPKGDELKREVKLYDLLSSEDILQRLDAANAIVSGLLGGDGVDQSTLQRHMERRLFRGLASGRKGARLGFSIVLTELLGQLYGTASLSDSKYTGLSFENVFDFLIAKTKPEGDLSGQEQKDHALGLLFGLQCFVRAKILFTIDGRWEAVLERLLDLSNKKSWTREECGWVIMEALEQMNQSQAESTLEKLCEAGLGLSPEGVGIWLKAKDRFPKMKLPSKPWGKSGNPLDHLNDLAKALKESSSGEEKGQQAKQTGTWNPKLHFIWDIVLKQYVKAANSKAKNIKSGFENFWKVAVDENLFSASASRERKFWGFLVFQKMIQDHISCTKLISSIFSHNLVRCLINHVQEKDRFLNRAADKSLKVLTHAVEENPASLAIVLQGLIDGNGVYSFDRITKTKTIEKLLGMIDNDNAEAVLDVLLSPILNVPSSENATEAEKRRQMFGDYVLHAIRQTDATDASERSGWIKTFALPHLASLAYSNSAAKPPLSDTSRTLLRNRLMSAFTHLLPDMSGYHYPCDLVLSCTPDAVVMDEGITNAKDTAFSSLQKLLKKSKKESGKDKATYQALSLLFALVIFQLYNGDSEAVSILDELKLCYDTLIRHKTTEDSDVEPFEVLVELLLSFLSRPSALLRKVTQHVFSAFMGEMTAAGLKLITDILDSSENLRGQQEMFDQNPDDEDEMDIDGEDDEVDSDVEVVDMDGEEGHLNAHLAEEDEESDEEEDEDEDEDDDGGDDEANKELNDALANILGTHALDQDKEDEDSESDADMTDSEMDALTPKLEEVLGRMQKKGPSKKQEQKDAKENMVNFKSRVLDLLDIYAKKQASDPMAVEILLPLLRLIRTTKTKHLSEKAFAIVQSFAKSKSKASSAQIEIDVKGQLTVIKAIHEEVLKDQSKQFAKAASTASLSLASGLYRVDKSLFEKIGKIYLHTMTKCDGEGLKIQASFVNDWVNWWQSHMAQSGVGAVAKGE